MRAWERKKRRRYYQKKKQEKKPPLPPPPVPRSLYFCSYLVRFGSFWFVSLRCLFLRWVLVVLILLRSILFCFVLRGVS